MPESRWRRFWDHLCVSIASAQVPLVIQLVDRQWGSAQQMHTINQHQGRLCLAINAQNSCEFSLELHLEHSLETLLILKGCEVNVNTLLQTMGYRTVA